MTVGPGRRAPTRGYARSDGFSSRESSPESSEDSVVIIEEVGWRIKTGLDLNMPFFGEGSFLHIYFRFVYSFG